MLFCRQNPKIIVAALIGFALYLVPRIVFGQDYNPVIPISEITDIPLEPATPWWTNILIGILTAFGTAIGALLTMIVHKGMRWLDGQIDNQYLSGVIQRATPVLAALVDSTYRAIVRPAKAAGTWDDETARRAKRNVTREFRALMGPEGFKKLSAILEAPETASEWISGMIEDAVSSRKIVGRKASVLKVAGDPIAG